MRELDFISSQLLDANITEDDVDQLHLRAEAAMDKLRRSGGEPKKARFNFVAALARIYRSLTGNEPELVRGRNRTGRYYKGEFLEFVRAALEPLDRVALQGVEDDILKVLAARKKPR